MSDETKYKERAFEFPMMPIFGVDLGERLGSMDARLSRVETDIQILDAKIQKLDAKIDTVDGRVDKCLIAINRLDERMVAMEKRTDERAGSIEKRLDSHRALMLGILAAVVAGIILQYFK